MHAGHVLNEERRAERGATGARGVWRFGPSDAKSRYCRHADCDSVFTGIHREEGNSGSGNSTPGLGSSQRDKLQAQLDRTGAMYSRTMLRCDLIEGLIRVAMLKYRESSCPPPGASNTLTPPLLPLSLLYPAYPLHSRRSSFL
jgi:hypothetical protein